MSAINKLLFSTQAYHYLKKKMLATGRFQDGLTETRLFPDGERYQRILTQPREFDAYVLGGTISDADTLELYDLASGLTELGARSLTLMIPYFGYGTMERSIKKGEIVTAKTRARLLSSIPTADYGNHILMLDLHSEGLPHYFEGNVRAFHIYAKDVIIAQAREMGGKKFVLACTDAGRAKWVESLANDMHVDAAFVFKRRINGSQTEVAHINADVQDRHVIIYDDMIRTGSSLIHAAEAYHKAGAKRIDVLTTHGLFIGNAYTELRNSGLFTLICSTDSHPNATRIQDKQYRLCSVADLLTQNALTIGA
ncbi:ribose-phosphate pyrophosphokinase [Catalinimonas alkaloidigena]|uniref:ribose-phosphate diphosphokinase n=1 Tax=Catalinimonas alkaloidigena TaxID=1075417 RepID=A0A1G9AVY3_9BACT|nr:ribose-phosphate diphosphokinase [Catalinimonas alkaloidigena]SDK31403.1 ribose-phosphate pyrophosphokinase [Catalinimonas alkaloidigena]